MFMVAAVSGCVVRVCGRVCGEGVCGEGVWQGGEGESDDFRKLLISVDRRPEYLFRSFRKQAILYTGRPACKSKC